MNKSRRQIFLSSLVILIGLDQFTKLWARNNLQGIGVKSYLGDFFRLLYAENTGAFLSLGSDLSDWTGVLLLTVIPLILLGLLIYFIFKKSKELTTLNFIGLCFILSGGLSNIADRIIHDKHVTDFLNLGIGDLRTGIFNLADLFVSTGAIIILIYSNKKKKR